MNGLYYLAEANLYLGVFYLAYCLFLNRNTHYQLSRAYLVFSCIIAFILPLMQVSALKQIAPAEPVYAVRQVKAAEPVRAFRAITPVMAPAINVAERFPIAAPVMPAALPAIEKHFTWQEGLLYGYLAGAAVLFLVLCVKLYALFKMMRTERSVNE